jgi:hypothetical protein
VIIDDNRATLKFDDDTTIDFSREITLKELIHITIENSDKWIKIDTKNEKDIYKNVTDFLNNRFADEPRVLNLIRRYRKQIVANIKKYIERKKNEKK